MSRIYGFAIPDNHFSCWSYVFFHPKLGARANSRISEIDTKWVSATLEDLGIPLIIIREIFILPDKDAILECCSNDFGFRESDPTNLLYNWAFPFI